MSWDAYTATLTDKKVKVGVVVDKLASKLTNTSYSTYHSHYML